MELNDKKNNDIEKIAEVMVRFGGGHLEARVPRAREDSSVDKLAFVVNLTMEELAARFRESEQQVAALEARQQELEKANQELVETQARLRHLGKLAALGEISAMIAHELNQPLTVITGYASHVLDGKQEPILPRTRAHVETIFRCAGQMKETIENLTRFSRKDDFKISPTEALEPADATLRLFKHQFDRLDIVCTLEAAGAPAEVLTDSSMIQQVFMNLLCNARDALTTLPPGAPRRIEVTVQPSLQAVRYLIRDSGPGVRAEDQEQIFQPFFTTKGPAAGTGLGLSLSRDIVKQMGGILELIPSESGGCFAMSLPMAPPRRSIVPPAGDK